jgi:gliding motility-associated-like protein
VNIWPKFRLLTFCLLTLQGVVAQNFIPNGGFEIYTQCPQMRNDGTTCSNWNAPTRGTSDYFNTCAPNGNNGIGVPNNFAGTQLPRTGDAYTGIYASQNFSSPFLEYREYMQVTLDSLLVSGGKYTFTMYISLGDNSNYASNKMGAYISQTRPSSNTDRYLNVLPQIVSNTYITDKTNWVKVTGEYIATGGEKYITIGVFEPAVTNTKITVTGGSTASAYNGVSYYYIDDVTLTRACDVGTNPLITDTAACMKPGDLFLISAVDTAQHTYSWNTGSTTKTINAPVSGKYIVKVSSPFCSVYDTITVTRKPIPVVKLGPDLYVCGTVDTLLSPGNPGMLYLWSTGDSTQSIRVFTPGTYNVLVTDNGCRSADTVAVFASPVPVWQLANDTSYCFQTSVTLTSPIIADAYLWSTGSNQPAITVNVAGIYWLEIQKEYCTVRDSIQLNPKMIPVLNLGPDRTLCKEQTVQINIAQANTSFIWQDGTHAGQKIVSAPGLFAVTVTSDDGCSVSDSLVLDTFVSPVITLGADTFICENTEIQLGVAGTYATYKWQNGSTASIFMASSNGNYALEVTDGNGCMASGAIQLRLLPLPIVNVTQELRICDPDTFVTVTGNFSRLVWDDGNTAGLYPITHYGSFTVTASDTNQCYNKATVTVLNNCPGKVFVPNVFTPSDPDGLNDVFYPVTRNVESLTFQVFNRWGEKVYETTKLLDGWNGWVDNKPAPADVYVYTVQYKTFSGITGSTAGNVMLLK